MNPLQLNFFRAKEALLNSITKTVRLKGFSKVVIGLSGGIDSTVVAYLLALALGEDNVFGFSLPYKSNNQDNTADAQFVANILGIKLRIIEITSMIDSYFELEPTADKLRRGNKMARERMAVLFDQAAALGAIVVGTSNKSEILLGYGTWYGDMAYSFNPIGELYKTQVIQMAEGLGVPPKIVEKKPTADFWPGQTDEDELGFSYDQVDGLLYHLYDLKYDDARLLTLGYTADFIETVKKRIKESSYKRKLPPIAKI